MQTADSVRARKCTQTEGAAAVTTGIKEWDIDGKKRGDSTEAKLRVCAKVVHARKLSIGGASAMHTVRCVCMVNCSICTVRSRGRSPFSRQMSASCVGTWYLLVVRTNVYGFKVLISAVCWWNYSYIMERKREGHHKFVTVLGWVILEGYLLLPSQYYSTVVSAPLGTPRQEKYKFLFQVGISYRYVLLLSQGQ